jgi:transcriptional regulator with GAF, ATPase, and Fis domain
VQSRPFSIDDVVIGKSPRMRAVFDYVRVIADSDSNVLITGETGTGKELIAHLIHHGSSRRHKPFVPVSCATFSDSLIESELFGHERGAFTGAVRERPGRYEMADKGTLFLDDVDDVPVEMQVKLLRVLQNRTIERVGGNQQIAIDVRTITGSKRRLKHMVRDRAFREDLYYRLNVIPIFLPPLRDRREDIPILAEHFLARYYRMRGQEPRPLSPNVLQAFLRYPWPGNVRELENACERMAQTCSCGSIRIGCVPMSVLFHKYADTPPPLVDHAATLTPLVPVSLEERLKEVEQNLIGWALKVTGGNKSKAAELLQIKRSTLGDRVKRLGLSHLEMDDAVQPAAAHDDASPVRQL